MLTRDEVERLDALCSAATAGPWVHDLAMIAESRTALPAALATIRELVEALAATKTVLASIHAYEEHHYGHATATVMDALYDVERALAAWDGAK